MTKEYCGVSIEYHTCLPNHADNILLKTIVLNTSQILATISLGATTYLKLNNFQSSFIELLTLICGVCSLSFERTDCKDTFS